MRLVIMEIACDKSVNRIAEQSLNHSKGVKYIVWFNTLFYWNDLYQYIIGIVVQVVEAARESAFSKMQPLL